MQAKVCFQRGRKSEAEVEVILLQRVLLFNIVVIQLLSRPEHLFTRLFYVLEMSAVLWLCVGPFPSLLGPQNRLRCPFGILSVRPIDVLGSQ